MKIITISREFGSGGRELGKRLAEFLGFDYYDSEIISAVAKNSELDAAYVAGRLDNHGWQDVPISFRGTLSSAMYLQSSSVNLLVQQKRVIEQIGALGKDCVVVGRNADVILQDYKPFNIFVCADMETKIKRCMEHGEALSGKELIRKIKEIDRVRARIRELISGTDWARRDAYHLTVNTSGWQMQQLSEAVASFAMSWFGRAV